MPGKLGMNGPNLGGKRPGSGRKFMYREHTVEVLSNGDWVVPVPTFQYHAHAVARAKELRKDGHTVRVVSYLRELE